MLSAEHRKNSKRKGHRKVSGFIPPYETFLLDPGCFEDLHGHLSMLKFDFSWVYSMK
jgi:hypothetical protein